MNAESNTQRRPIAVFLLGRPGAGKGTQARALAERLGFERVTASDLIRAAFERGEGSAEERRQYEEGELVTPSWVIMLVKRTLQSIADRGVGIVMDGAMRTLPEAKKEIAIARELYGDDGVAVLLLDVSKEEARRRSLLRLVCGSCGTPLMPGTAEVGDPCPDPGCDGRVTKRDLDHPALVQERLEEYHDRTESALAYLREHDMLTVIPGEDPPAVVTAHALKALQPYLNSSS